MSCCSPVDRARYGDTVVLRDPVSKASPGLREAKLTQHRGLVPLLPAFGHPAVENAIEDEPPTRIGLPVGRAPANGPVFVPSATNRVATLSPPLMWSSMVK